LCGVLIVVRLVAELMCLITRYFFSDEVLKSIA
jgi:hypothetical protein